ncbi:hypothetical protein LTR53_012983 [Teratosphaeriaceae sp. CCFEE 6253]|nr:hypothetical protein LTR53_012983 [Teratosphaeriaceae sp. CCFEE 6253]
MADHNSAFSQDMPNSNGPRNALVPRPRNIQGCFVRISPTDPWHVALHNGEVTLEGQVSNMHVALAGGPAPGTSLITPNLSLVYIKQVDNREALTRQAILETVACAILAATWIVNALPNEHGSQWKGEVASLLRGFLLCCCSHAQWRDRERLIDLFARGLLRDVDVAPAIKRALMQSRGAGGDVLTRLRNAAQLLYGAAEVLETVEARQAGDLRFVAGRVEEWRGTLA